MVKGKKKKKTTEVDKDVFRIDPMALDREWFRQSELVYDACREQALARRDYDLAKRALVVHEAELDGFIRASPGEYGLDKVTEGAITKTMASIATHQEKSKAVIETHFRWELRKGVVASLENKRDALKDLVKLEGRSYFAEPIADDQETAAGVEAVKRKRARTKGVRKRGDSSD